jgi:outer membrane receptor protein involved in Fe transport
LTDFYTKDINGLSGGIDIAHTQNLFDDLGAFVKSPNGLETVARRDVSLLAIVRPTDDSTALAQANVYYTHLERNYSDPGSEYATLHISDDHYAELSGIRIQQSFHTAFHVTELGLQTERSQYASNGFSDSTQQSSMFNRAKRTISSVFATSARHPLEFAGIDLSARYDHYGNQPATSFGVGLQLYPLFGVELLGEAGVSFRFPTFQESSWADSTIQRPAPIQKEKHTLYRTGVRLYFGDHGGLSVTGFDRSVDDAIVFQPSRTSFENPAVRILNVPHVHTRGIAGDLHLRYGPFALEGTILYTHYLEADTMKLLVPDFVMSGELTYRNKFFNDALDAKFGVRSRFMNGQRGMTLNPRLMLYTENTDYNIGQWTRLDLFAILKIGDAYLTLSYENLLNADYLITPIYPMPNRTLRFGVNWVFID